MLVVGSYDVTARGNKRGPNVQWDKVSKFLKNKVYFLLKLASCSEFISHSFKALFLVMHLLSGVPISGGKNKMAASLFFFLSDLIFMTAGLTHWLSDCLLCCAADSISPTKLFVWPTDRFFSFFGSGYVCICNS